MLRTYGQAHSRFNSEHTYSMKDEEAAELENLPSAAEDKR